MGGAEVFVHCSQPSLVQNASLGGEHTASPTSVLAPGARETSRAPKWWTLGRSAQKGKEPGWRTYGIRSNLHAASLEEGKCDRERSDKATKCRFTEWFSGRKEELPKLAVVPHVFSTSPRSFSGVGIT